MLLTLTAPVLSIHLEILLFLIINFFPPTHIRALIKGGRCVMSICDAFGFKKKNHNDGGKGRGQIRKRNPILDPSTATD